MGYPSNSQAPQTQPAADGSAPHTSQPSTSEDNAPPSVAAVPASSVAPQPAIDPYALYAVQYAAAVASTGDPALDAAQRWNSMNCSYFNSLNGTTPTTINIVSKPSPLKSTATKSESSVSDTSSAPQLFEAGGGETKWSPELKDYVRRAFLSTETAVEKDQMERILRQKIEYVFCNNKVVDWTKEQIPVIPKISSFTASASNSKSSINLVRPPTIQPWKTRGNAGSLQTGTLARNQTSNLNSGLVDSFQKTKYLSPLPQSADSSASDSPSKFHDVSKRKRSIRPRSRSSSSEISPSKKKSFRGKNKNNKKPAHANNLNDSETDFFQPQNQTKSKRRKNKKHNGKRNGRSCTKAKPWVQPDTAQSRLNERAERFKDHLDAGSIAKSTSQLNLLSSQTNTDVSLESNTFAGTMQELEKPYLRLTKASLPSEVRPESVLHLSLAHVLKRYRDGKDYHWVCDQLKSIRQDLIVQRIQSEFAAKVYETHADLALEVGDSSEFHQCQSQLALLHTDGYGASRRLEFTAYRLLYYISTEDQLGMNKLLSSLKSSEKTDPFVRFALKVREFWSLGNYKRFFNMACNSECSIPYETESCSMQACRLVLAWSLERERKLAAKKIFMTYRPTLSMEFITRTLGFADANSCSEFLTEKLGTNVENLAEIDKVDCNRTNASDVDQETKIPKEKDDISELDHLAISPMADSRCGNRYNRTSINRNRLIKFDKSFEHLSSCQQSSGLCIADMTRRIDLKLDNKDQHPSIVGTMQALEKPYLRLSKTPDPSEIRPPEVLQLSLHHILKLWKNGERKYAWVSDQFKSMRQDLLIQRIYSELAIEIYESNAKVAIDAHDPLEFNKCQSQLFALYSSGTSWPHRLEFIAHRILYYIFIEEIQGLNLLFMHLKPSEKENVFVQFALRAYDAWSQHNYKRLVDLANCVEFVGEGEKCKGLLSWSLPRERQHAVRAIFKSYRQTLSLDFIAKTLGFADTPSCINFFADTMGISLDLLKPSDNINCKEVWSKINQAQVTA
nr:leukocyte receptor cluster [Hymenolepis microstoma]